MRPTLAGGTKEGDLMAYGIVHHFPGGTSEQYEASIAAVHPSDGSLPDGQIFHAAGPIEGGWGVIDFWESREAFDRFLESGFGPAAQELGDRTFTTPPDIKEFPVHNITKP